MQVPSQTSASSQNTTVIRAARCVLLYATVQNTSGADRFYALVDAASAPALTAAATTPPAGCILSPRIAAGQTWTVFPSDLIHGAAFNSGCVLMSFATANGAPNFTALSAADATVTAWSALC